MFRCHRKRPVVLQKMSKKFLDSLQRCLTHPRDHKGCAILPLSYYYRDDAFFTTHAPDSQIIFQKKRTQKFSRQCKTFTCARHPFLFEVKIYEQRVSISERDADVFLDITLLRTGNMTLHHIQSSVLTRVPKAIQHRPDYLQYYWYVSLPIGYSTTGLKSSIRQLHAEVILICEQIYAEYRYICGGLCPPHPETMGGKPRSWGSKGGIFPP